MKQYDALIKAGMDVGTRRPDMGSLVAIQVAVAALDGERHAPELPIPRSAAQTYAAQHGLSDIFVGLVRAYDAALMNKSVNKASVTARA